MSFIEGKQAVFQCGKEGISDRQIGLGFIFQHEKEQGNSSGVMRSRIVLELSGREEIGPASGVVGAEYVKVGLDLLIGLFHLSISLGVVGSGKFDVIFEESGQFSYKCRGKLGFSVRHK